MGISQRKLHAEQRCLADLFLIFIITTILGTLWYSTWCLSHFFFFLAWNKASFIAQKGGGGGGGSGTPGTFPWLRHWRTSILIHSRRSDYSFLKKIFSENIIGKCARSSTGNFSANCCHVLSRFYLWERIHDPVSVTWIAFNGKLMGFE